MSVQIEALHSCWCLVTGQDLHLKATERIFYEMAKLDFTPDDLQIVLQHVLHYNKTHKHAQMKVQVHKLCEDLAVFASILAEARAIERNKVKSLTPKDEILTAWRPINGERVNGANVHRISEFLKIPPTS